MALSDKYPVYNNIFEKGFSSVIVKSYILAKLLVKIFEPVNSSFSKMDNVSIGFNLTKESISSNNILDLVTKKVNECKYEI
jgi:hypothetical protein